MKKLLIVLLLSMPFATFADENGANYKLGDEVHAWTDLQRSGVASNPVVQPMPGEIADKVYDRYMKTFEYPIPQNFDRESFVGRGSGSGSGGQ